MFDKQRESASNQQQVWGRKKKAKKILNYTDRRESEE